MEKADRRVQKTKTAIFQAMFLLLAKEKYSHISVQDIIDEANIGRSTFYSHFETKDLLLQTMCEELLGGMQIELEQKEGHRIYVPISRLMLHIKENIPVLKGILQDECRETVTKILRKYWIKQWKEMGLFKQEIISQDFLLNYVVGSIIETIFWWYEGGMKTDPVRIEQEWNEVTNLICKEL